MPYLSAVKAIVPPGVKNVIKRAIGLPVPSRASSLPFHQTCFADIEVDTDTLPGLYAHAFPKSGPEPWLDRPDAQREIDRKLAAGLLTPEQAELCRAFERDGYVILENFFDHALIDSVWADYEKGVREGRCIPSAEKKGDDDPYPGHVMNAHLAVPEIGKLFAAPKLIEIVGMLLGRPPIPFQTLMFPEGREQKAHSDSIHMTTYPLGYLSAAWIACEDIHPDSGALAYWPGSHRMPYVFSRDVGIAPGEFQQRSYGVVNEKYEPYIERMLAASPYQRKIFTPRKGDVLIWHANLIHGGSERTDVSHSRKSLVCHYFCEGALCYHDLSGTLADVGRYTAEGGTMGGSIGGMGATKR